MTITREDVELYLMGEHTVTRRRSKPRSPLTRSSKPCSPTKPSSNPSSATPAPRACSA